MSDRDYSTVVTLDKTESEALVRLLDALVGTDPLYEDMRIDWETIWERVQVGREDDYSPECQHDWVVPTSNNALPYKSCGRCGTRYARPRVEWL